MPQSVNIEKIAQDSRQIIAKDGIIYIFMGVLLATVGFALINQYLFWVPLLGLLLIPVSEALRKRITYPRIGYVKFTTPKNSFKGIAGFAILAALFLIAITFIAGGRFQQFLPLAIALVFALSMYFGLSMQGLRRRDWLILGLILSTGLVASFLFADWHQGTAIMMWVTGTLLIVIGLVDLRRFIRNNPILPTEDEDEPPAS